MPHKENCVSWLDCRLELKGNKHVLGEFLEFKGKQEDVQALRHIKRSKINRLVVQKTSMLGFGNFIYLWLLLNNDVQLRNFLWSRDVSLDVCSHHNPSILAAPSKLQVMCSRRDYRSEGASASEWKEVTVRSSTEVVFQLDNSSKVRKFKLSSICSMSLSG